MCRGKEEREDVGERRRREDVGEKRRERVCRGI